MTVAEFINKVGFKVDQNSVNEVNKTISSIKSTATKVLGTIGIGLSLSSLNSLVEEFDGVNTRIKSIVDSAEDLEEAEENILASANACKVSYSSLASSVQSLVDANSSLFSVDEATTFAEYINKIGKNAGYSDSELSSMQTTMKSIMASGTASASQISSMISSTPAFAKQLASALGVTTDSLETMADAGELTAETIKDAILGATDEIDAAFEDLNYSISDALLNIRNQWGFWVNSINETLEITQTIAKLMVKGFNEVMKVLNKLRDGLETLTARLGGAQNTFKLIAAAVSSLFVVMNFSKIISGAKKFLEVLWSIKLSAVALAAAFLIVFLVIDDLINFMKGNDSVIGYAFQQAGIDAEEMRDKIVNIWTNLVSFFSGVWDSIKAIFQPALDWIKGKMEEVFGDESLFSDLGTGLEGVINGLERFTEALAQNEGLQDTIAKIAVAIIGLVAAVRTISGVTGIVKKFSSAFSTLGGKSKTTTTSSSSSGKGLAGTITSFFSGFANIKISTILKGLVNMGIVLAGVTAMAAAMMAISPYLAELLEPAALIEVLLVIAAVGLVGTGLAELAGLVGNISVSKVVKGIVDIAIALGAMTILSTAIIAIAEPLAQLSNPTAIAEILLVVAAVGVVGAALAALAGVVGLIPFAVVTQGLADIAVAITGFTAIATAYGALSAIPGFSELISSGLDNLSVLANGIGSFVGNLIGGVGEGISDALPAIGTNLADFAENVEPFFTICGGADLSGVSEFLDAFASFILKMTANDLLSFFTGGTDLSAIGDQLSDFALGVADFFAEVADIPEESFANATLLFESLSGMGNLVKSGGIAQLFTGETDFTKVADGLEALASYGVTAFYDMVAELPEETFTKATSLFESLSNMGNVMKTGGVAQFFTGETDFAKVSDGLAALASQGVTAFYDMVADLPEETFTKATSLFESLSGMGDVLKTGGVAQFFTGESDYGKITDALSSLASDSVKNFYAMLDDLPSSTFTKATSLFESLSGMGNVMKTGGIAQFFTGESDYSKITSALQQLSSASVKTFYDMVADLPSNTFSKATDLFDSLSGMGDVLKSGGVAQFFTGESDYTKITSALGELGKYSVSSFFRMVEGLSEETFPKAKALFESLSDMGDVLQTGGIAQFFTGTSDYGKVTDALAELASDGVSEFFHMVQNLSSNTFDKAKSLFESLSGMGEVMQTGGIAEFIAGSSDYQKVADALQALVDGDLPSFFNMVSGLPEEGFDKAVDMFKTLEKMSAIPLGDIHADAVNGGTLTDLANGVRTFFGVIDDIDQTAIAWIKDALDGFNSKIQQTGDVINDEFNSIGSIVSTTTTKIVSSVKNAWSQITSSTETTFKKIGTSIQSGLSSAKTNITSSCTTIKNLMVNAFNGLPDAFEDIGKNIMQGLANGISNGTSVMVSAMQDAVNDAVTAAKEEAGVNSPSTRFRDEVGQYLPEGAAVGVEENSDSLTNAVSNMINSLFTGSDGVGSTLSTAISSMQALASTSVVSPVTALTAAGGSTDNSRNISQNVNITNTFNGDKAIQQKASSAMNTAAEDITEQLARGLAYAR